MFARPLVYLMPAAAAALYAAVCLGLPVNLYLSLLLFGLFLLSAGLFVQHRQMFTIFCLLAAAAGALSGLAAFDRLVAAPCRALNGRNMVVTATVLEDATVYDDSQRAELLLDNDDRLPGTVRTLCYLPPTDTPLLAGDRIEVSLGFYIAGNTEGFDRAAYQAANGCFITSSYNEDEAGNPTRFALLDSRRNSLRFLPQRIARRCGESIRQALPPREAGLLCALLLGDKSTLSETDALSLRVAGLSHLIAVSGLHIGFLAGFCYLLLGRKWGAYLSIPLVLLFVPVAGASPSVIRAAVMYLIPAAAFLLRKEANTLNSLCAALGALLLINPYSIASLSLQLSFSATLGLILFADRMQRRLTRPLAACAKPVKKLAALVVGALSCSVCAMLFTAPIVLTSFGHVSVLSVLSNLLVLPVTAVCFIGGLLLCVLAAAAIPMAAVLAAVLRPLLGYMLGVAGWVADLPFGQLHGTDGFSVAMMFVCFAALLLWLIAGKRVKWRIAAPCFGLAMAALIVSGAYYAQTHFSVTYLPCGNGQAILVSDSSRYVTLIDCAGDGGYRDAAAAVREWLLWHGYDRVDALVLTAVDKGHARDLPTLLEQVEVGDIWIPDGCKDSKNNKELLTRVRAAWPKIVAEKQQVLSSVVPITLFPVVEGKLGVLIDEQVLVLHSPTQKQLDAFWDSGERYAAAELVLSERNLSDAALLRRTLAATQAERIVIQAGYAGFMPSYEGVPVRSPYISGEIQQNYTKGGSA